MPIDTPYEGDDFYCDVALPQLAELDLVHWGASVVAYHHTRPSWPVHIVVIPTAHIASLTTVTAADEPVVRELLQVIQSVATEVESTQGAARVVTNLGRYQDSKHLHLHVASGDRLPSAPPVVTSQPHAWMVRDYDDADQASWLRCRVLGFLDTSYFDDVFPRKPRFPGGVELVAVRGAEVVGICDASIDADNATIESIVVHPDHRRRGIAHALADAACRRLREVGATTVDAWTREDVGTLAWYRAEGFAHEFRYLHVYASTPDEMLHAATASPDLMARNGHFHAWQEHEEGLRASLRAFSRCNRVTKLL